VRLPNSFEQVSDLRMLRASPSPWEQMGARIRSFQSHGVSTRGNAGTKIRETSAGMFVRVPPTTQLSAQWYEGYCAAKTKSKSIGAGELATLADRKVSA